MVTNIYLQQQLNFSMHHLTTFGLELSFLGIFYIKCGHRCTELQLKNVQFYFPILKSVLISQQTIGNDMPKYLKEQDVFTYFKMSFN